MKDADENTGRTKKTDGDRPAGGATRGGRGGNPNMKGKIAAVIGIAVAASLIVLIGSSDRRRADSASVARVVEAAARTDVPTTPPVESAADQDAVWGPTLDSLAALNELAADEDAVFVLLPDTDGEQTEAIRPEVEAATRLAQARGLAVTAYTLSAEAEEYSEVAQQMPLPCVLAIVKGAGALPVTDEITEETLWEALLASAQAASCGPTGCGHDH